MSSYPGGLSGIQPPKKQNSKSALAKPPFVPFGSEPVKDRPTAKQSRDEINAIRKYGQTPDYQGRYGDGWTEDKTKEAGQI